MTRASGDRPESLPPRALCCDAPQRWIAHTPTVAPSDTTIPPTPPPGGIPNAPPAPAGMAWIPAGVYVMGSDDPLSRPDERPVHSVQLDGFWMDTTEVTNRQFRAFVEATGYVTTAERAVNWDEIKTQLPPGTPKPPDQTLQPGASVFTPPTHPVDLLRADQWWTWTPGASWRHPRGPASSIEGKDHEPVVQVSWDDAMAFCAWAGKRLPTEAEWEAAARGGLPHAVNVWGDQPITPARANTWQGRFPDRNTQDDGFEGLAPVRRYPPNGYGLFDMPGNVWEWCADSYRPDTYARRIRSAGSSPAIVKFGAIERSVDPRNPFSAESRVLRGGSFLCHDSYCASYRPSARMAAPRDNTMCHIGFRCVITPEMLGQRAPAPQAASAGAASLDQGSQPKEPR